MKKMLINLAIKFKKLKETAKAPTRGSTFAAGWDLTACIDEDIWIQPGETIKIDTGLAFELPTGTVGLLFPRSGLATKNGIRPANCVGKN